MSSMQLIVMRLVMTVSAGALAAHYGSDGLADAARKELIEGSSTGDNLPQTGKKKQPKKNPLFYHFEVNKVRCLSQ